jgi:hypothetical protein
MPIVSVQFFLGSPNARIPYSAVSLTEILLISGGIGKSCIRPGAADRARASLSAATPIPPGSGGPPRSKHTLVVAPKQIGIHKIVRDNNEKLGILALLGAREGRAEG